MLKFTSSGALCAGMGCHIEFRNRAICLDIAAREPLSGMARMRTPGGRQTKKSGYCPHIGLFSPYMDFRFSARFFCGSVMSRFSDGFSDQAAPWECVRVSEL
jgi:hypothetical protein